MAIGMPAVIGALAGACVSVAIDTTYWESAFASPGLGWAVFVSPLCFGIIGAALFQGIADVIQSARSSQKA